MSGIYIHLIIAILVNVALFYMIVKKDVNYETIVVTLTVNSTFHFFYHASPEHEMLSRSYSLIDFALLNYFKYMSFNWIVLLMN